jgi:NAD(P)H dehydrogenase (quinone)
MTKKKAQKTFADSIADLLAYKGAEVIDFDWSDPTGFEIALKGVKTVFCSIPHMDGWADVFPQFLKVCRSSKVEHFVKISFIRNNAMGDQYRANVPFVKFHATCDELLEQSSTGLSHTILGCTHFMSTPLLHQGVALTRDHKFVTASYGMGVNYISPNDVSDAVMVVLLNRKDHRNKSYNLTGKHPVFDSEIAELLSKKYAAPIQHIELGYHKYKLDVQERGLPEWLVRDSAEFERMKASGIDEKPTSYCKDLEVLIGRQAATFEEYLDSTSTMRPGLKFNLSNK